MYSNILTQNTSYNPFHLNITFHYTPANLQSNYISKTANCVVNTLSANALKLYMTIREYANWDKFKFSREWAKKATKWGNDRLTTAIKELEKLGILKKCYHRKEKGYYAQCEWKFSDLPTEQIAAQPAQNHRRPETVKCDEGESGLQVINNTNNEETKEILNTTTTAQEVKNETVVLEPPEIVCGRRIDELIENEEEKKAVKRVLSAVHEAEAQETIMQSLAMVMLNKTLKTTVIQYVGGLVSKYKKGELNIIKKGDRKKENGADDKKEVKNTALVAHISPEEHEKRMEIGKKSLEDLKKQFGFLKRGKS